MDKIYLFLSLSQVSISVLQDRDKQRVFATEVVIDEVFADLASSDDFVNSSAVIAAIGKFLGRDLQYSFFSPDGVPDSLLASARSTPTLCGRLFASLVGSFRRARFH